MGKNLDIFGIGHDAWLSDELFDKVLSVNLHAAFVGTQLAAREMVASGRGGVIINMSSVSGGATISPGASKRRRTPAGCS